jgi:periplasmic protein TonB
MLAYAANRPQAAVRRPSPKALVLIVGAHVAVLALVMTARMDLPQRIIPAATSVDLIRNNPPPPRNVAKPVKPKQAQQLQLTRPERQIETSTPVLNGESTPILPNIGQLIGPAIPQPPKIEMPPLPLTPAPTIARLLTPPSELKPPYPQSKLLTGEEATLDLRLSIDEQGRVVAVDPIGSADRTFLDAARRHLIAHWRYRPATRDGRPVASSLTITLRFELD